MTSDNRGLAIYWLLKESLISRSRDNWRTYEKVRTTLDAYYTDSDIILVNPSKEQVTIKIPDAVYSQIQVQFVDLIPNDLYPLCKMCGRTFQHYDPNLIYCPECLDDENNYVPR